MNIFKSIFGRSAAPDLKEIMGVGVFLVDVRSPGEFAQGHVKGSVNIPVDVISSQLAKFEKKKNIVVFCRSGSRASFAKSILAQHGFTNVVNGGTSENVSQYVK